jgi:type II secretory pathway pseudopilin PulG
LLDKVFGRAQSSGMKPRLSNRPTAALTMVEVMVVISIIAVLVLCFFKTKSEFRADKLYSANIICINNLKQIGLAYRGWEGNHGDKFPMQTSVTNGGTTELANGRNAWINFSVMSNELSTPKILICPADWDKVAGTNFTTDFDNNRISYFVGLNADENYPQTFLSGDDNFESEGVPIKSGLLEITTNMPVDWSAARHRLNGRILFSDGSVLNSYPNHDRLPDLIRQTGLATNRLAIP